MRDLHVPLRRQRQMCISDRLKEIGLEGTDIVLKSDQEPALKGPLEYRSGQKNSNIKE